MEPIVELRRDSLHRHLPAASGRQLQGERNAIEPATDLRDGRSVLLRDRKSRAGPAGSIDEQPDGLVLPKGWHRDDRLGRRRRQRMDSPCHLAKDAERLARRREHVHGRVLRQERGRERGAGFQEMFAVVEDEQRLVPRRVRRSVARRVAAREPGALPSRPTPPIRPQPGRPHSRAPRTRLRPGTAREARPQLRARDASCPLLPIPST